MKKLLLALGFCLLSSAAFAQNTQCATRPPGDNTNACASTAFVETAIGGGGSVTSVFGRTGVVVAATNDYTIGQIGGLGTGIATAMGINIGSVGAPIINGGALGTPSSGVGTNFTGVGVGFTAGSTIGIGSLTTTVNTNLATAPSINQVLTATDSTHATWQAPATPSVSTSALVTNTSGTPPAAGKLGEIISATGGAISLSVNTVTNLTSDSLTAGDWQCGMTVDFAFTSETAGTGSAAGITTSSATIPAAPAGRTQTVPSTTAGANAYPYDVIPIVIFHFSATTTVFGTAEFKATSAVGVTGTANLICVRID